MIHNDIPDIRDHDTGATHAAVSFDERWIVERYGTIEHRSQRIGETAVHVAAVKLWKSIAIGIGETQVGAIVDLRSQFTHSAARPVTLD